MQFTINQQNNNKPKKPWYKKKRTWALAALAATGTALQINANNRIAYMDREEIPNRLAQSQSGRGVAAEISKLKQNHPKTYNELQNVIATHRDTLKNTANPNAEKLASLENDIRGVLGKQEAQPLSHSIERLKSVKAFSGERGIEPVSITNAVNKILITFDDGRKPDNKTDTKLVESAGKTIGSIAKTNSTSQDQAVLRQNERLIQLGEQLKNPDVKMAFGSAQSAFNELAAEYPQNKQFAAVKDAIAKVRTDEQAQKLLNEIKVMTEAAKTNPHNGKIERGAQGATPPQVQQQAQPSLQPLRPSVAVKIKGQQFNIT